MLGVHGWRVKSRRCRDLNENGRTHGLRERVRGFTGSGRQRGGRDRAAEEMARARVAASGLALDVLGEEMGGGDAKSASASGRARMIIDPIDGTEEFSRGIPTFGTL